MPLVSLQPGLPPLGSRMCCSQAQPDWKEAPWRAVKSLSLPQRRAATTPGVSSCSPACARPELQASSIPKGSALGRTGSRTQKHTCTHSAGNLEGEGWQDLGPGRSKTTSQICNGIPAAPRTQGSSRAAGRRPATVPLAFWGPGPPGGPQPSATWFYLTQPQAGAFQVSCLPVSSWQGHPWPPWRPPYMPNQWTSHQPRLLGSKDPREHP